MRCTLYLLCVRCTLSPCLPSCTAHGSHIHKPKARPCSVCCLQLASRLAQIDFHGVDTITIDTAVGELPAADILTTLSLLEPLCLPDRELAIAPHSITPELAAVLPAVAAAAAGCRRLSLSGLTWSVSDPVGTVLPTLYTCDLGHSVLTDTLLSQLVKWAPSVTGVRVKGMGLTTALGRMPCKRLRVCKLAVGNLVHQAGLVGEGVEWELEKLTVLLTPEQVCTSVQCGFTWHSANVMAVAILSLAQYCVPFGCVCAAQVIAGEHVQLARQVRQLTNLKRVKQLDLRTPPSDNATPLRAALAVARALPCEAGCLTIRGWYATEAVVSELRGLPPWRHVELDLTSAYQAPGGAERYRPLTRAAVLIPRCASASPSACMRANTGAHTHTHTRSTP